MDGARHAGVAPARDARPGDGGLLSLSFGGGGLVVGGESMAILLALGFGLFGALCLGLGLYCFFRDRRLLRQFSEVGEGVVSGFTESDDEGFVRPRVLFVHGRVTVTLTGSVGSNPTRVPGNGR